MVVVMMIPMVMLKIVMTEMGGDSNVSRGFVSTGSGGVLVFVILMVAIVTVAMVVKAKWL